MEFLNKYVLKYWKPFALGVSILMVEAAADLAQPTIMSKIVDQGVKGKHMDVILHLGLLMLLVTAAGASAAVGRNIIASRVSQNFGAELRGDLYRKIQSLSFENLDHFSTASLITRLTNDVTQVQGFFNGMMRIFVKAPLVCIGSIVMASFLNWHLALVLAVVVPIVAVLILLSISIGYPYFNIVQKSIDRVNGVMREYLSGVRVVKAFNRFRYETERFRAANQELTGASTAAMRIMSFFSPGIILTVNIGIAVILWLGGSFINTGHVLVGQVIAFVNYMTQILVSLMMISMVFNAYIRAKASLDRIGAVMSVEGGMQDVAGLLAGNGADGTAVDRAALKASDDVAGVTFDDVSFSYTGASGDPVLKNITFRCPPGETLGIIGSTGAGKSSLVNLIPRFYDASVGSVKVGEADVRSLELAELRERIAVVPQKTVLFTGTILENIRWGRTDASEADVIKAAKAAQAHGFIESFPEGYGTLLGKGGVNLSGGQKQRIAIARALVREPEILILDDCTSAVDIVTEAKIRQALKEFSKDLTCFLITQRISSVMSADRILVLDDGEIRGIGPHEDLMRSCEIYKEIHLSQIGKEGMSHG